MFMHLVLVQYTTFNSTKQDKVTLHLISCIPVNKLIINEIFVFK
jgi:hypothetical protein